MFVHLVAQSVQTLFPEVYHLKILKKLIRYYLLTVTCDQHIFKLILPKTRQRPTDEAAPLKNENGIRADRILNYFS